MLFTALQKRLGGALQAPSFFEEPAARIMLPKGRFYMFVMTGAIGRLGRVVASMLAKLGFAGQVAIH
jgi:hypothetical protein